MPLTPCSQPFGFELSFVGDFFLLCINCVQFLYNLRGSFVISQGFRLDADSKKRKAQHVDTGRARTQSNQPAPTALASVVGLNCSSHVTVLSPLRHSKENLRHSITFTMSNTCWLTSVSHSDTSPAKQRHPANPAQIVNLSDTTTDVFRQRCMLGENNGLQT